MKAINLLLLAFIMAVILMTFTQPIYAAELTISEDGLIVSEDITREHADAGWNQVLRSYKNFVIGFFAMATLSMVFMFIYAFINLGASAGNPGARAKAVTTVLWTGIATAILGGTLLFFSMFYNMF